MAKQSERVDKWLWAIRAYKTRTIATDACRNGRVQINGVNVKASREVKIGDVVSVKKMPVIYSFKVLDIISNRQPSKNVPLFAENITPQEELDKLFLKNQAFFMMRDRGEGRPTKKDRRDIDALMSEFFFDDDNVALDGDE